MNVNALDIGGARSGWTPSTRAVTLFIALMGIWPSVSVAGTPEATAVQAQAATGAASPRDEECAAAEQRWPTIRLSTDPAVLAAFMQETPPRCSAHDAAELRIANLLPSAPPSGPPDPQRAAQADAALAQLHATIQSCPPLTAAPPFPDGSTARDSEMRATNNAYNIWALDVQDHLHCRRAAVIVAEAVLTPAIPAYRPTVPQEQVPLRIAIDQYSAEYNRDTGLVTNAHARWRDSVERYNARNR